MNTPTQILERYCIKFCQERGYDSSNPSVEQPPSADMGDLATTLALSLGSQSPKSPRDIANNLADYLHNHDTPFNTVEVEGPGFVNVRFADSFLIEQMHQVIEAGQADLNTPSDPERVLIEFVSANPTGPLHVGHGRGAVYGDVLCRLFDAHGYDVQREYYVNDAGQQMDKLGKSFQLRAQELDGQDIDLGDDHYKGDYIREIVKQCEHDSKTSVQKWAETGADQILTKIFDVLDRCDIKFDNVCHEQSVAGRDRLDQIIEELDAQDLVYQQGGATYLETSRAGDDKDRVLVRSNDEPTYFARDLLYHHEKFQRGFDRFVDIWGHDHHGYQDRLNASVQFLDHDPDDLEIELYQLVNLFRAGEPVSMSTRGGEFVPLNKLVDEVGVDAVRFNFLTTNHNSPLDFDIDVAISESEENPVYYVQYAHTRMCGILRNASDSLIEKTADHNRLTPEGHQLVLEALRLPDYLANALRSREPHRITHWLRDRARQFHSYYGQHQVLDDDAPEQSALRLDVINLLKTVFGQALGLLSVNAPERM